MAVLLFYVLLLGATSSSADTANIFKIETPLDHKETNSKLVYDSYNENMLPLLSRDLTILSHAISMIENDECRSQCELILNGLHNLTTWAVKFYDASGKIPVGVLSGSVYQLGNFDECFDIGKDEAAPQGIHGQYCLGEVGIDVPESYLNREGSIWEEFRARKERYQDTINKLHWGICVPASCAPQDVEDVIQRVLPVALSGSQLKLTPRIPERYCYKREPLSANHLDIVYACVILSFCIISFGGTVFHIVHLRRSEEVPKGALPQSLYAFSIISNFRKLCSPAHLSDLHLECISGMKFIAMFLIICGHTLIFVVSGPVQNKTFLREATTKIENALFVNSPLLVDTFLLLSGFLMCRILLGELDKRKSINFLLLYAYRYLRLTPVYLVMVGLYMTWLPKLDSGPLWARMEVEKDRCLASWWTNMLYVNNYVNTDQICMFQSWYLSVDTQLFMLAPALVYPLWKWQRLGKLFLAGATTVAMLVPFTLTLVNSLDPTLMIYSSELKDISTNEYFKNYYIKTHMRATSYCFGIIYGYIAYKIQTNDYNLSKNTVRLSWILSGLSLIASMFSITVFYGPRLNFTSVEAAIYASMHRALWSIGSGWVLVACITNNAGPLRLFLKWRPFIPLSRLTYSAYLMNGFVELHSATTVRAPQYLNNISLFREVCAHLLMTFIGAVILSMLFESPILGLEKIFLKPEKKMSSEEKSQREDTVSTEA